MSDAAAPGATAAKPAPGPAHSFVGHVAGTFAAQLVSWATLFGTSILVARGLGPHGRGALATLNALVDLAMVAGAMGVGRWLLASVPRPNEDRSRMIGTAVAYTLPAAALAALAALGLAALLADSVFAGATLESRLVVGALVGAGVLTSLVEPLLRGLRQFGATNRAQVARQLLYLAIVVGLYAGVGVGVARLLLAQLAAQGIALLLMRRALRREGVSLAPGWDSEAGARMLRYGLGYQLLVVLQLLHWRGDAFLLSSLRGASEVGYYSIAVGLTAILHQLCRSITFVLVPWLAAKEEAEAPAAAAQVLRVANLLTLGTALALAATVAWLVPLLYGDAFRPSVPAFYALLPGALAYSVYQVLSSQVLGRGRIAPLTIATAYGLALNVVANLVLIPRLGALGASLASTASYTLSATILVVEFRRTSGLPWRDLGLPNRADLARLREVAARLWRRAP